jgi:hypothetical protein
MYECGTCGYETKRKWSIDYHNNRKIKCKPKAVETSKPENDAINLICQSTNGLLEHTCVKCSKSFKLKQVLTKHFKTCSGPPTNPCECQICFKIFKTSTAKCQHNRKVKCELLLEVTETLQEENERQKMELKRMAEEIKNLKSGKPIIINNDNSTNINVIQYNNYDKPYTDHITNKVMKRIFETSQRDPALILNETVRRIYKNDKHPENHVIKIGEKTALSKVFKDGKEIWLPMDGVLQTVMSSTGEFCADRLRDCHEEGVIEGTRVVVVWKLMEVLGTDDRDDDCMNRSTYIQSIKSAFL